MVDQYLIPDLVNIVNEYQENEQHDALMFELLRVSRDAVWVYHIRHDDEFVSTRILWVTLQKWSTKRLEAYQSASHRCRNRFFHE